jgi:hypothetical protein
LNELPSTDQLLANPELAVLHALDAALAAAQQALLAAHPELEEEDLAGGRPLQLDAAGWLADAILTHIAGLEAALRRHRGELHRQRCRAGDPF